MHRTAHVGTALFFLAFLAGGIIGAEKLAAAFEPVRSEYLGASGFLFLLCFTMSAISTALYAVSLVQRRSYPKWYTGLLGGVVAAGAFGASFWAGYAEPGFGGVALAFALILPALIGWLWPFLSRKV